MGCIALRKLNLDWLTFFCGERWICFSLYNYLRAGDAPAKDIGTAAAYCFQRALFAPRHPRIGGLFLGMAGPFILAAFQLPHVGHERLRQLYRPGGFEPRGVFGRGVCRCQNGQNISRITQ